MGEAALRHEFTLEDGMPLDGHILMLKIIQMCLEHYDHDRAYPGSSQFAEIPVPCQQIVLHVVGERVANMPPFRQLASSNEAEVQEWLDFLVSSVDYDMRRAVSVRFPEVWATMHP